MGPCMSLCESTPDVPKNIIADPEVRRTRARASSTIILGIIPFDLSVRESVYGHTRPTATGNTRRKHTKIRSYVIDTSLAWDDRTLRANATREWRVPSKRAGANQSPDSAKSRAEAKLHGAAAG